MNSRKRRVLEPGGAELLAGDDAGDAFHVDGDVELQLLRLLGGGAAHREKGEVRPTSTRQSHACWAPDARSVS